LKHFHFHSYPRTAYLCKPPVRSSLIDRHGFDSRFLIPFVLLFIVTLYICHRLLHCCQWSWSNRLTKTEALFKKLPKQGIKALWLSSLGAGTEYLFLLFRWVVFFQGCWRE
jgi:hypothetical protein